MASKDIKYLNKDFDGFKSDLISFAKQYFPNDYKDFNESSTGMMLVENMAYLGDVLSFYLDKQFKETFLSTASQRGNIIDRAEELGYFVQGNIAATTTLTVYCEVDAVADTISTSKSGGEYIPSETQCPIIKKNSELSSNSGEVFRITEDIDFSNKTGREQAVSERDIVGNPSKFALKKKVEILAGKIKQKKITVTGIGQKSASNQVVIPEEGIHLELNIDEDNVIGIESIFDSSNNEYYETNYLAQDTVYITSTNESNDSELVPQLLKLKRVPRRFITRFDEESRINIVFGNGTENLADQVLIANPADVSLPLRGRRTFTGNPINPENFTQTNTMGILPQNTTLTINYIVGGGKASNVAANTINAFSNLKITFNSSTTPSEQSSVRASIVTINTEPSIGGSDPLDDDEIRDRTASYFAAQDRCVTQEDFIVRAMTMPKEFGQIYRTYASVSDKNTGVVQIYVLSRDNNDNLVLPSTTLKENLKQYLRNYRMLTDQIEILPALVINIGVEFSIVADPSMSKNVVLSNCLLALKEYFKVENWQIGQAVIKSDLYELLHNIEGVLSIANINILNKTTSSNTGGLSYSTEQFTVMENETLGVVKPPSNAMLYVKYPNNDLRGSVV